MKLLLILIVVVTTLGDALGDYIKITNQGNTVQVIVRTKKLSNAEIIKLRKLKKENAKLKKEASKKDIK